MRVALVTQPFDRVFRPHQNSLGLWAYEVAHWLARSCTVTICTRVEAGAELGHGSLNYHHAPISGDEIMQAFDLSVSPSDLELKKPFFTSTDFCRAYIDSICDFLGQQPVDIVHLFNFTQYLPSLRRALPKSKIILHMQSDSLPDLDKAMVQSRLEDADLVSGCSDFVVDRIKRRFGGFDERSATVYNGVDVDHFRPADRGRECNDSLTLLYVGRISPEKGCHILVEAFSRVVDEFPNVVLKIVGPEAVLPKHFHVSLSDDPLTQELAKCYEGDYCADLLLNLPISVGKRIDRVDAIAHRELPAQYQAADLLIAPSVWHEGFGMPIAEAMACGIPVVATWSGGIPEVVGDQKTGLLVPRGDADALAEAIIRLLGNNEMRAAMGKAGRARVMRHFSWKVIANSLQALYDRILV